MSNTVSLGAHKLVLLLVLTYVADKVSDFSVFHVNFFFYPSFFHLFLNYKKKQMEQQKDISILCLYLSPCVFPSSPSSFFSLYTHLSITTVLPSHLSSLTSSVYLKFNPSFPSIHVTCISVTHSHLSSIHPLLRPSYSFYFLPSFLPSLSLLSSFIHPFFSF